MLGWLPQSTQTDMVLLRKLHDAAHDSSQSTRLEGKNGPHFKAFTSGASRPMWLVGCRLELLMDKSELVRVQHNPQVLDLVVSYVE